MKKQLGQIAEIKSGYTFRQKGGIYAYPAGDVLVFQAKDILAKDLAELPSIALRAHKHYLRDGDVLLAVRGSFRALAVKTGRRKAVAASSVIIISITDQNLAPEYLAIYLNSPHGQEQLRDIATGATIRTLTISQLQNIPIPIPPPGTQQALIDLTQNIQDQQCLLDRKKLLLDTLLNTASTQAIKENQ